MQRITQTIVVGKRDVKLTAPSHVRGVREGNQPVAKDRELSSRGRDGVTVGSARRSTGINAEDREPIDPTSPRLSPA